MSGSNSAERKRYEPLVLVETADLSEEDWLDYRRRGIGGSDVSAIFGTSPFRTARDLYYDKLNIASVEDDEGNWVAMEMGHLLEPLVAKIFERKTGYRVYQIKKMFQHPQYPWMLADVDYFVELPDGTTAILEIKTTNYNARDNWWMNGKETVPVYYESQGRHYMAVTDLDRCFFCCLYGNNEEEVIIREVKRDFEYEAEMVFLEQYFWENHVQRHVPPPYTESGALIIESARKHFGPADKNAPAVALDLDMTAKLMQYLRLLDEKKNAEVYSKEIDKDIQRLKALLIAEMGTSCTAICEQEGVNYTVTYTPVRKSIIDKDNRIHMARMDMHYGHSVNGVAFLHTEILKNSELHDFYEIYPEKFNNKTNGITFRRWLLHCNHPLADFLTEIIGDGYKKDAKELEKLLAYKEDETVLRKLIRIKKDNKERLAEYLKETQGLTLDTDSIFDIQVKRLHEYKRQQLNALYGIHKYLEIKSGKIPKRPITLLFGAKAAPAYVIAKDIIHLILCLQKITEEDPDVSPYLKVVMVENYNVTNAQMLIPACDISEQISLASKEASGTGNMKFMLNGAVTLGTEDGANVEIHQFVGDDNIYIFGEDSDTVIARYERGDYCSKDYYKKDPDLKQAVDFITGKEMLKYGDKEKLTRLYKELLNKDWFMTFPDYKEYVETKERAYSDYEDSLSWAKKMLVNISKAGFFSSDRTIAQYDQDIWHL